MRWDDLLSQRVDYDPAAAERPVLPGGGGVYLLSDEQDRLIQLASAADLKRAIANRLGWAPAVSEASTKTEDAAEPSATHEEAAEGTGDQPSPDTDQAEAHEQTSQPAPASKRRADLSQIVRHIRWQPANSAFEIAWEYLRIARDVLPTTYLKNIAFGPAWFVHVDPAAAIPRFTVTKIIPSEPGSVLGPFSTQQDANRFVQILEDAFDLCRYINILEQAPHGQPCAYHEMGRCPAPCGGLIPMSQYRETMREAVQFAAGQREAVRGGWEGQMRQAASELAFERAAAIKQRIERARELDHTAYRFVRPLEAFSWLVVQRGGGRTRVKPFFVRGGRLAPGETAKLKDLASAVPAWIEAIRGGGPDRERLDSAGLQELSEQVWLVSHFLFRREQTGLFIDAGPAPSGPAEAALEPAALVEMIREHFTITRAEPAA